MTDLHIMHNNSLLQWPYLFVNNNVFTLNLISKTAFKLKFSLIQETSFNLEKRFILAHQNALLIQLEMVF